MAWSRSGPRIRTPSSRAARLRSERRRRRPARCPGLSERERNTLAPRRRRRRLMALSLKSLIVTLALLSRRRARTRRPIRRTHSNCRRGSRCRSSTCATTSPTQQRRQAGARLFRTGRLSVLQKADEVNFAQRGIVEKTRKHFVTVALDIWGDRQVTWIDGRQMTEKELARVLNVQFTPTLLFFDERRQGRRAARTANTRRSASRLCSTTSRRGASAASRSPMTCASPRKSLRTRISRASRSSWSRRTICGGRRRQAAGRAVRNGRLRAL